MVEKKEQSFLEALWIPIKEGGKGLIHGISKFFGEFLHGTGEAIGETGGGVRRGIHAAGYGAKGLGRIIEREARNYAGPEDPNNLRITKREYDKIIRLAPDEQARELQSYVVKHRGHMDLPYEEAESIISELHKKYRGKSSPLEEELHKYVAIILFGLALIFLFPLSITGFAVMGGASGAINYKEIIGVVLLLSALFLFVRRK